MIACFLSNISAKYYKNPSMLSRVIAKNVGDVFFETQCSRRTQDCAIPVRNGRQTPWDLAVRESFSRVMSLTPQDHRQSIFC